MHTLAFAPKNEKGNGSAIYGVNIYYGRLFCSVVLVWSKILCQIHSAPYQIFYCLFCFCFYFPAALKRKRSARFGIPISDVFVVLDSQLLCLFQQKIDEEKNKEKAKRKWRRKRTMKRQTEGGTFVERIITKESFYFMAKTPFLFIFQIYFFAFIILHLGVH